VLTSEAQLLLGSPSVRRTIIHCKIEQTKVDPSLCYCRLLPIEDNFMKKFESRRNVSFYLLLNRGVEHAASEISFLVSRVCMFCLFLSFSLSLFYT